MNDSQSFTGRFGESKMFGLPFPTLWDVGVDHGRGFPKRPGQTSVCRHLFLPMAKICHRREACQPRLKLLHRLAIHCASLNPGVHMLL